MEITSTRFFEAVQSVLGRVVEDGHGDQYAVIIIIDQILDDIWVAMEAGNITQRPMPNATFFLAPMIDRQFVERFTFQVCPLAPVLGDLGGGGRGVHAGL